MLSDKYFERTIRGEEEEEGEKGGRAYRVTPGKHWASGIVLCLELAWAMMSELLFVTRISWIGHIISYHIISNIMVDHVYVLQGKMRV